jgi:hypothetical protein
MTQMTRNLLLLALLGLSSTACLTRTVIRLDDHPDRPVSLMETIDTVLYTKTHQFWLCKDTAAGLSCEKTCGGQTDLACQTNSNLKQQ